MANTRTKKLTHSIRIVMEPEMIEWLKSKTAEDSDISKFIRKLVKREIKNDSKED